jgi:HEXXH motif-containing protein
VFAAHAALLKAALADRSDLFAKDSAALCALNAAELMAPVKTAITPLSHVHLSESALNFLRRAFSDDIGLTTDLASPSLDESARAKEILGEALQVAQDLMPEWHGEFTALVSQVLLAVPASSSVPGFGGASTFDAFGSILINPRSVASPEAALMALIHESSHHRLFLYHLDDPVILNDAEARYGSPLRREPRPMEGLFHAVWVSARMALAAEALLRTPGAPDWAKHLDKHKASAMEAIADGMPTIENHAEFTTLGALLFEDVRKGYARMKHG